jgi:hypothetical protein
VFEDHGSIMPIPASAEQSLPSQQAVFATGGQPASKPLGRRSAGHPSLATA